jgi:hypothetical protein
MGFQYDVKAAHAEATGTIVAGRSRLKAYQCLSGGTAGDVIIRDGGASGPIRLQFNISSNLVAFGLPIPGDGIVYYTNMHVTLPANAKITVFYG